MDIIPHVVEDLFVVKLLSDGSIVRLDESNFFTMEVYSMRTTTSTSVSTSPDCRPPTSPSSTFSTAAPSAPAPGRLPTSTTAASASPRCCKSWWLRRTSVTWLRDQALLADGADVWLRGGNVDYGRVFVMGDSSGGNMAHHMAVKIGPGSPGLDPVQVRGYVLVAPFFGGTVRTKSEEESTQVLLNSETLERAWRMSLPSGSSPDDPWANPFGPSSPELDSVKLDPILVPVGGREVMKDRIEDYYKKMKAMGKEIEYVEFEGEEHGFLVDHPSSEVANAALQRIHQFMSKN